MRDIFIDMILLLETVVHFFGDICGVLLEFRYSVVFDTFNFLSLSS
jgi:hypothetical protein